MLRTILFCMFIVCTFNICDINIRFADGLHLTSTSWITRLKRWWYHND